MLGRDLLSLPASRRSALSVSPAKAPEIALIVYPKRSGIHSEHHETYCAPAAISDRISGTNSGHAHASTEEDAGFAVETTENALEHLRKIAAGYVPAMAEAEMVDSWAGLRPDTPDHMPIIGQLPKYENTFAATGHFRNGILLAPVTAELMTELLLGEAPAIDPAFAPDRF